MSLTLRLALAASLVAGSGWSRAGGLREDLEGLATRNGVVVDGLEWIGSEPAPSSSGALPDRIRALLHDYNYLLIQGGKSGVERIKITSRKEGGNAGSADRATVSTARVGPHHQVETTLVGPNGIAKSLPLILDTGASTLVLPASLIAELGFRPEDLTEAVSQTASGRVPSKLGTLSSVRVGAVAATGVRVSFIADARLQGAMLLGMSFLQRFRVTLDDGGNELILLQK